MEACALIVATRPDVPADMTALPPEILDDIARRLDKQSLVNLALTCKKIYASATGALYQSYSNRAPPAKAPFHLFLRTICERPDLAAQVKAV